MPGFAHTPELHFAGHATPGEWLPLQVALQVPLHSIIFLALSRGLSALWLLPDPQSLACVHVVSVSVISRTLCFIVGEFIFFLNPGKFSAVLSSTVSPYILNDSENTCKNREIAKVINLEENWDTEV